VNTRFGGEKWIEERGRRVKTKACGVWFCDTCVRIWITSLVTIFFLLNMTCHVWFGFRHGILCLNIFHAQSFSSQWASWNQFEFWHLSLSKKYWAQSITYACRYDSVNIFALGWSTTVEFDLIFQSVLKIPLLAILADKNGNRIYLRSIFFCFFIYLFSTCRCKEICICVGCRLRFSELLTERLLRWQGNFSIYWNAMHVWKLTFAPSDPKN